MVNGKIKIMYEIDIKEIKSFIRASHFNSMEDPSFCFIQITEITNEVFLDNRARKVADAYKEDSEFNTLLSSLASICNKQNQQCDICPINKYCNHAINNCRQEAIQQNNLKMVDLFCGAGGLSLGFTQEGFITSLANDILDCCVDTYAHNHPETPRNRIIQGDIKEVVDSIENLLKGEKIDIVVGGPPCQGFSMANRQRLIDDPRNHLYKNFVQVVQKIAPPFFVMENVKGMLPVANQVIDDFSSIGYETKAKVLNARDFGVPQNRERLIYIGNRIGIDNQLVFDALEKTKKSIKKVVLEDALFGLKTLQASRKKNATDLELSLIHI